MKSLKADFNKYLGAIFGLIVGDALGVPAEFKSRANMKDDPVTDMIGYGTHNQPAGTWSDDSSMVIATMEWLGETKDELIMGKEWIHYCVAEKQSGKMETVPL